MAVHPLDHWAPIIVRADGISDWERKFLASIIAQGRKGRKLSRKQAAVFERIVNAFKERELRDGGVIE